MTSDFRTETDSMGEVKVPSGALYQAQTQRAVENFSISKHTMPHGFIHALAHIKQTAALTNAQLGLLEGDIANAIADATQTIIDGLHLDQFPIDVFQTGSGTSSNMNANEVIASLAGEILGGKVSPNDHVNMGQSSNDVVPTAIQVSSSLAIEKQLIPALTHLSEILRSKQETLKDIVKTGRTHLMDAMPVTFAQELGGWQFQIEHAKQAIEHTLPAIKSLAQGGTAVGTGINADPRFAALFADNLSQSTRVAFSASQNFFFNLSSQDAIVALSGQLKTTAVAIMKIANDLRWMNSGPLAGLGEIELQGLQPGSSIMPGKVNPVIPEAVAMACAQVIGNDTTITIAGQSGNFQLNVMLPVIAHNILESIDLLSNSATALADKAIATFEVRQDNLDVALAKNPILVTALNPVIGYSKAAEIAKKAYKQGRAIIDIAEEDTDLDRATLERLLNPAHLTRGGVAE
ncbi:Involved in the TCA cycle. Catalyzes the stereospecific interconversion of fumarate to L-malate [Vibrio sp. B1FLJ16]|uniref:class II fumarate hydratase n=1 Tax=Vibrio sp. B1FLJ16 TaxID=2751178 RepID=UPI0015F6585E|nr:class II fumarate hydratase [Vibrio sp. B1FLJ16]CAD7813203.1 Involved in the TCA cycle. Catalyzes the stereospecific interconversion of fumarate to L-malate [Vibrio sp. B1FLJ16]CAE6919513.1 Involved in the TCA cycle. Catalyzes the stereospecific interconversion of fumarate to L-malate [Vibrio sp. B1FLJ16]